MPLDSFGNQFRNFLPRKGYHYLFSVVATAAAIGVTLAVPALREHNSLVPMVGAVTLSAWFGGTGPSVVTVILGATAWSYFVIEPRYQFKLDPLDEGSRLLVFAFVSGLITYLQAARLRSEAAQLRAKQQLAFALHTVGVGVWDFNMLTGEFWWSPELRRIFGCFHTELPANYAGFLGFIHPDDRTRAVEAMTCAPQQAKKYDITLRVIRLDNQVRWVHMRGQSIQDASGRTERMVGVATDVTDRIGPPAVSHP